MTSLVQRLNKHEWVTKKPLPADTVALLREAAAALTQAREERDRIEAENTRLHKMADRFNREAESLRSGALARALAVEDAEIENTRLREALGRMVQQHDDESHGYDEECSDAAIIAARSLLSSTSEETTQTADMVIAATRPPDGSGDQTADAVIRATGKPCSRCGWRHSLHGGER